MRLQVDCRSHRAWGWCAGVLVAVLLVAACSPTLNWREVRVGAMAALLPCKPDRAQRATALGSQQVSVEMAGCEAAGALFALSHVHLQEAGQVPVVLAAWQASALHNLRSTQAPAQPNPSGPAAVVLHVQGQRPDGSAVQAQLAWWVRGTDVYHAALYATRITPDMRDTFFTEPRWP